MALATLSVSAEEITWLDVTSRFIENSDFNSGNNDGWTVNSNAGQRAVSAKLMRFWNGTFDFSQQLNRLPKGRYRLSVQGFYRPEGDSEEAYWAHQNGTERLTAYLYAGETQTLLVSVYSEAMTSTEGTRQQHDGKFFPDNSTSAAAAFAEGLYQGNSIEFEADGSVTIGIRSEEAGTNNYCAFDNFKLEYATSIDGKAWIDVTDRFLTNTGFADNSTQGWTWDSNASSQKSEWDCMEFWNGKFDIWQTVSDAPQGTYRLSVQAFYRCMDNEGWWGGGDYSNYVNGAQNITGYMYAGEQSQKLRSVYTESMNHYVNGSWEKDGRYYPNSMESAYAFFEEDRYWNTMEFVGGGTFNIGLRCQDSESSNWCIFDNFKLELFTDIVAISSISVSLASAELIFGETTEATATLLPANATLPFVDWTSSNPQVATVDRNGIVTAVGTGTAVITAIAGDGSGVEGSTTVSVVRNIATAGSLVINEIMPSNIDEYISPAFNFDGWVELYNPTGKAVELVGVKVSDPNGPTAAWTMPQTMGIVPAKGYRLVWFDSNDGNPNNAPFKLDTDGSTIVFTAPDGQEIARQNYPTALERVSYARSTDVTGSWGYCGVPTPGTSNNGSTLLTEQYAAPVVSQPSQLFTGSLNVRVTIPSGCTLRYTTDGTLPTMANGETSGNGQFTINETTSFRFRLFGAGKLPSRVTTRSYIYKDRDYYLPVVSVVTDPDFLYSTDIGVFAKGPNGRPGRGQSDKCNWNMDWERPVNFSYITADGVMALNQDVNLEMCGGWSRAWTPHSFKLKGNKEMGGDKNLLYPFFEQKPYIRNRTLQIRNGGNDTGGRFVDPALQVIAMSSGIDIDYQSYQPVHEFINGSYMGLLNVREPNNKHFVYANYGWDDDEIDFFEMSPDSGYVQMCGTPDAFNELVDVLSPEAANPQTYAEICRVLDIDEFINYMALELWLGGTDFPQNNIKAFRHRDNGRFRFILFDLDFAFDTDKYGNNPFSLFFGKEYYQFDQLYPASLGRRSGQIRVVTLLKNLLNNADFRRRFIDTYCIMGGSVFEKERSSAIIDELLGVVSAANSSAWSSANNVRDRLNGRLDLTISNIRNYSAFNLSAVQPQRVTLSSDTEGARLFINNEVVPTGRFDGQLFPPVTLRAEAPAGYVFKSWRQASGSELSSNPKITMPNGTVSLTATFRPMTAAEKKKQGFTPVRINEISGANDSYIDEYGKKGDWVELYNTTAEPVDVEGMYLSDNADKPTKYMITKGTTRANTIIPAHGYLIIWCDKRETTDRGLHASFKISDDGGEMLLTAKDQSWTDFLDYGAHDSRTTIGRYPDGTANVYAMNVATIGKGNILTSYVTPVEQKDRTEVDPVPDDPVPDDPVPDDPVPDDPVPDDPVPDDPVPDDPVPDDPVPDDPVPDDPVPDDPVPDDPVPDDPVPDGVMAYTTTDFRVVYGSGLLLTKSSEDGPVLIEVFRSDGQTVLKTTANVKNGTARVSVATLPQGFYVARATDRKGRKVTCRYVK
jgi:hypothetical protein